MLQNLGTYMPKLQGKANKNSQIINHSKRGIYDGNKVTVTIASLLNSSLWKGYNKFWSE